MVPDARREQDVTGPAVLIVGTFLLAWTLTGRVRRYAVRNAIFDHPNERSSHSVPTPTGGGLAIVATLIPVIAVAAWTGYVSRSVAIALAGGLPVAIVGWIDDRRGVGRLPRLAVQVGAACWSLWWLGGLPCLRIGSSEIALGSAGALIGLLGLVWATNSFNFMDGIDGLAGGEAVTVGAGGGLLLMVGGHGSLATVALVIATASAGFLFWNWAPARIFLGDIGSGFLGFLLGTLAIASENAEALPLVGWLLLFGVFAFDATATLIRRAFRQERWYEAHRSHAYQRAVQSGWSHRGVTVIVIVINCGLTGAVWAGCMWPGLQWPLGLACVALLAGIYFTVHRAWAARAPVC